MELYKLLAFHKEDLSIYSNQYIIEQFHYLSSSLNTEASSEVYRHDNQSTLLLHLSIIRQLFSSSSSSSHCDDYHIILLDNNLLIALVKLVNSQSLFVSYAARKACISVLIYPNTPYKVYEESLSFLLDKLSKNDCLFKHGIINYLQLHFDFLKITRKELINKEVSPTKQTLYHKLHFLLTSITSQWHSICNNIILLATATTTTNSNNSHTLLQGETINQTLLNILLLGCEILKHDYNEFQKKIEIVPGNIALNKEIELPSYSVTFTYDILNTLDHVLNQLCNIDLICLTRIIDIYSKCIKRVNTDAQIDIASKVIKYFYSTTRLTIAIEKWFQYEGHKVLLSITQCDTMDEISSADSVKSLEDLAVCTFVRKLWTLSLLIATTLQVTNRGLTPVSVILDQLRSLIYHSDCDINDLLITQLILHLVSEHDDCLIQTLINALHLTQMESVCVKELQIDQLLIEFLTSISFDHTTMIDFLIENGNNFDLFFINYLTYLTKENGIVTLIHYCQKKEEEYCKSSEVDSNDLTSSKETKLVDYSDSDTESELDVDLNTNTDFSTDINTDINTDANTDINTDTNTDSNTDVNTDLNTDTNSDTNTDINTDTNTDTNTDLNIDFNTDKDTSYNSTYSIIIDLFNQIKILLHKMIHREEESLSESKLTRFISIIDSINHLLLSSEQIFMNF